MLTSKIPMPSAGKHRLSLAPDRAGFDLQELGHTSSSSSSQDCMGNLDVEISDKALLGDEFKIQDDDEMSWASLLKLTVCIGGLQMAFSIQFANGTIRLLDLGISPPMVSLIWLAPPICGVLLQPCFGYWSDSCSTAIGNRKPFILGGSAGLALSLLSFAWATDKMLAGLSILAINVSAQAIQVGARALMIDVCPQKTQLRANAWASRVVNTASICSYMSSYVDLPHMLPFLGNTQLKCLAVLGCALLFVTSTITCIATPSPAPIINSTTVTEKPTSSASFLGEIRDVARTLPTQINRIHAVQLFSWFAWFPFLLYISSFVGKSYLASIVSRDAYLSAAQIATLSASSDRYGALSLLTLSLSALFNSIFLPQLLSRVASSPRARPGGLFSRLTHRNIWFVAQIVFSVSLYTILSTDSSTVMIVAVGFVGFSWAVTQWIPFALISMQVKMMSEHQGNAGNAAVVLGIHNVFIAAPQILASVEGTIIFGITGAVDGADSASAVYGISWILMGSGIVSVVAAGMVLRLTELSRTEMDEGTGSRKRGRKG